MTDAPQHPPDSSRDPPAAVDPVAPLPATFFDRSSVELATALLGTILVRDTPDGRCAGLIVETEAYAGVLDRASHARAGRTPRTAPMFGPGGHAYVYLVYGIHHCLNVVAGKAGEAGAVLIRALAPLSGVAEMRRRREGGAGSAPAGRQGRDDDRLCAGPGRLCQAMAIDRRLDGHDLTSGHELWLAAPDARSAALVASAGVVTGPRIGVGYAGPDWSARPWRYGVRGHPALSRPFPTHVAG